MIRRSFIISPKSTFSSSSIRFCSQKAVLTTRQRAKELDEKCFSWNLTSKDMEEVIEKYRTFYDHSQTNNLNNNVEDLDFVSYPIATKNLLEQEQKTENSSIVSIPFELSVYFRCLLHYSHWRTVSLNKVVGMPKEEIFCFLPSKKFHTNFVFPIYLPSFESKSDQEISFVLWSSEEKSAKYQQEFFKEHQDMIEISGYEHFYFSQVVKENQTQFIPKGIMLDPDDNKPVTFCTSDFENAIVSEISDNCRLEYTLTLMESLFSDDRKREKIDSLTENQKSWLIENMILVLQNLHYYGLVETEASDKKYSLLFTSMHHVRRYQKEVLRQDEKQQNVVDVQIIPAEEIDWISSVPVINPSVVVLSEGKEKKFPGSAISFSKEAWMTIFDLIKTQMLE
jgi:hypothetical protein